MNIIVIGGHGFIGAAFVKHLLALKHQVTIVSRKEKQAPLGASSLAGGIDTLAARPDLLSAADYVCHLASATIPSSTQNGPLEDIELTVSPTLRLLEAMRESGNRRLMYLSSGGAVYGVPKVVPIPETHPREPISYYGLGKLMIENYLDYYRREHGFQTAIIRPANPYGPGQGKIGQLGAVTTFLRMIENGDTATLFGDGSIMRDFVYIDDLCDLMLRAINQHANGTWNCGGGTGTSLKDLIGLIERATGKTLRIDPKPPRPFDPPKIVLDINRAMNDLGWCPKTDLLSGIIMTRNK